jgi:hypothetical protein
VRYNDGIESNTEVFKMKKVIKVLLFPFTFILTIVIHILCFVVEKASVILNIISGLLFLGALLMGGFAIFKGGHWTWQAPVILAVVAFLISPYGLPKLAVWLVEKIHGMNEFVKSL